MRPGRVAGITTFRQVFFSRRPMATQPAPVNLTPAQRVASFGGPSVFAEFSPLAVHLKSVNLGQGFPTFDPPSFILDAAAESVRRPSCTQYARSAGHVPLVEQVARVYGPRLVGRPLDAGSEVVVTVGASEAIFLAMQAFVQPGDELLLVEPFFDIYKGAAELCGATPTFIPLRPSQLPLRSAADLHLDLDELRKVLTPKTRMLLLNSPHNPTGKVFTRAEYMAIAEVLQDFPNCLVLSDEVYEHLVFDGHEHVPFASIPGGRAFGMWDRTLSVYSAGKTFSVTAWKWICFSVATPLQDAVAQGLQMADRPYEGFLTYYHFLAHYYSDKRTKMLAALEAAGLPCIVPQGAFFILADTAALTFDNTPPQAVLDLVAAGSLMVDPATLHRRDYSFARRLSVFAGVTPIPPSAFYSLPHVPLGLDLARFAFCKRDDEIAEAAVRLKHMALQ